MKNEIEIYDLSNKDKELLNETKAFQLEIQGNQYRLITSTSRTIRFLARSQVTIPLGNERFRRKHFGITDALR